MNVKVNRRCAAESVVLLVFALVVFASGCDGEDKADGDNGPTPRTMDESKIAVADTVGPENVHDSNREDTSNSVPKGTKVRCRGAPEGRQRSLCKAVMPPEYVEDTVSFDAFEITFNEVDLNREGRAEVVAWESSWAGTSGGGLWVLRKVKSGHRKIFETEMTWSPIILLPSSRNGWRDFAYLLTGGGVRTTYVTVGHDGRSYKTVVGASPEKPEGEVVIERNWGSSVFGPISGIVN